MYLKITIRYIFGYAVYQDIFMKLGIEYYIINNLRIKFSDRITI